MDKRRLVFISHSSENTWVARQIAARDPARGRQIISRRGRSGHRRRAGREDPWGTGGKRRTPGADRPWAL